MYTVHWCITMMGWMKNNEDSVKNVSVAIFPNEAEINIVIFETSSGEISWTTSRAINGIDLKENDEDNGNK